MKRALGGFTLIELMIVVAIIGVLSAVAIPSFMKYVKKAKTNEAREMVKKIYEGAREYYMDRGGQRGSVAPLAPQFPAPSIGATPVLGSCCDPGTGRYKCPPLASQWTNKVWVALKFSVDDPHFYQYSYNQVPQAYTAVANGDLDCDGQYSTFEMYGEINSLYSDGPTGSASLYRENDLE